MAFNPFGRINPSPNYLCGLQKKSHFMKNVFLSGARAHCLQFFHTPRGRLKPLTLNKCRVEERKEKLFSFYSTKTFSIYTINHNLEERDKYASTVSPKEALAAIAKVLECSVDEMDRLSNMYSFFNHLAPAVVKEKVVIMQMYGLPTSFVRENPRLLYQVSASELLQRLRLLSEYGLLKAKHVLDLNHLPHYLETNSVVFEKGFQNLCANLDAYEGCLSRQEYLMVRLGCSRQEAQKLLTSYPLNRKFSQVKLKNFLDFMLNEAEMSQKFVMEQMKIFSLSMSRLRLRLKVMRTAEVTTDKQMVVVWMMSEKRFNKDFGVYL